MAEEWDVFQMLPGDDAPVLLATLYEAREKTIRVERDGTGSGSFAVNRASPECTETVLAQGNLVKVRIPEIHTDYLFAFFLETGDFTLISSQEAGGEMLNFGGRGGLSYLGYGQAWSESYIVGGDDPEAGVWRAYNAGTGAAPGQILRRLLEEFQDPDRPQQPIPHLTIDFDYDDDSAGDPWDTTDATDEFSYQVGERGLAIVERLLETDTIRVQMDPDFLLHAWNVDQFGRDLTGDAFGAGVVRFVRGVNIATELRRQLESGQSSLDGGGGVPDTHMLAQGEADKYGTAALAGAAARVTKEGFIAAFGTGTTALNGIAAAELRTRLKRADTIMFQIANRRTADVVLSDPVSVGSPLAPLADAGFYLPGPEGTNGDFWVGDTVRVHTGSGPFDYDEVDAVVKAITISRDDDNAELIVIPELQTLPPVVEPFAILYRPQSADTNPGQTNPIGWICSGDPQPCSISTYGVQPTVGPLEPTAGTISGTIGTTQYLGLTFSGSGTIDFVSTWEVHTACSLQQVYVDILVEGVVVATGGVITTGGTGNPVFNVDATGIAVSAGDLLTAQFRHAGGACTIYVDGVNENFRITGGALT